LKIEIGKRTDWIVLGCILILEKILPILNIEKKTGTVGQKVRMSMVPESSLES